MLSRLCIGQLPRRYHAAEQPCAHPAEGSTQGVGDHVVHIAAAVGVGVDAEQARELGHLDEQGRGQAQQHRREEAQAQKPPGDKAQRHEKHHVEGQLKHGLQAVLRNIVHEVHRVEVGGDAVGDAGARITLGQRVQRETAKAADVEHREVGSHKRAEAQPPVAMVEVGQNRQREHEREHRPQHERRGEVLAVISQKMLDCVHGRFPRLPPRFSSCKASITDARGRRSKGDNKVSEAIAARKEHRPLDSFAPER